MLFSYNNAVGKLDYNRFLLLCTFRIDTYSNNNIHCFFFFSVYRRISLLVQ